VKPGEFARLAQVIAEHWEAPYRKVLECAPDVSDAMTAASNERSRDLDRTVRWGGELVSLLGIEVHIIKALPEGAWTLTRHSACKVTEGAVSHEDCPVIATGESGA
jgi:hypothetical protein